MNSDIVPMVFFLICCFIIVVPFSVLVIYLILKGRKQAWTGTIIDKLSNEVNDDDDGGSSTYYSLKIKSDEGKEFKMAIDSMNFKKYKIGDRLKKESGKLWPSKI